MTAPKISMFNGWGNGPGLVTIDLDTLDVSTIYDLGVITMFDDKPGMLVHPSRPNMIYVIGAEEDTGYINFYEYDLVNLTFRKIEFPQIHGPGGQFTYFGQVTLKENFGVPVIGGFTLGYQACYAYDKDLKHLWLIDDAEFTPDTVDIAVIDMDAWTITCYPNVSKPFSMDFAANPGEALQDPIVVDGELYFYKHGTSSGYYKFNGSDAIEATTFPWATTDWPDTFIGGVGRYGGRWYENERIYFANIFGDVTGNGDPYVAWFDNTGFHYASTTYPEGYDSGGVYSECMCKVGNKLVFTDYEGWNALFVLDTASDTLSAFAPAIEIDFGEIYHVDLWPWDSDSVIIVVEYGPKFNYPVTNLTWQGNSYYGYYIVNINDGSITASNMPPVDIGEQILHPPVTAPNESGLVATWFGSDRSFLVITPGAVFSSFWQNFVGTTESD
jgi:hypothetical protein